MLLDPYQKVHVDLEVDLQRAHSFMIKTLGFTEIHHIEDDTLKNKRVKLNHSRI